MRTFISVCPKRTKRKSQAPYQGRPLSLCLRSQPR